MNWEILLGTAASAALLALAGGPAAAISVRDDIAAAAGGIEAYYDSGNAYPNVGSLRNADGSYCSGSLLNSRTMLTAAHCFLNDDMLVPDSTGPTSGVSFAPQSADAGAVAVSSILPHSGFTLEDGLGDNDIAIVALARPVNSLTPIVLPTGRPGTGGTVLMAGYGYAFAGSSPGAFVGDNRRRIAFNVLDFVGEGGGLPTGLDGGPLAPAGTVVLSVDFDNPGSAAFSSLGAATALAAEGAVVSGDSGGPLFLVQADGSLVQVGVLSGGDATSVAAAITAEVSSDTRFTGYGDLEIWTDVFQHLDWLSSNAFLQTASAVAADGVWSSAAHWSGGAVPDNSSGYVNDGAARYWDVGLDQSGTTSLDMNAAIDTLIVNNDAAVLDIAAPWTLTAEVGTTLAAGTVNVAGSLTSAWVTVTGGTLSGSGTVTAPQGMTQSGGTISPGGAGAIGTLSVAGAFSQTGGILYTELSANAADLLSATGAVSLVGGLQVALLGSTPPADGQVFTVASGSTVEASALAVPASVGAVTFSLAATGPALQVTVGRQALGGFASDATGRSVGTALDRVRGQAAFAAVFDSLDPLPSFQMARALDQLGGVSTTAGSTSRAASAQFLGAASQRVAGVRGGAGALGAGNTASLRALLSAEPEAAALLAAEQAPAGEQLVRPRLSGPTDGQGASLAEAPAFALGRDSGFGAASTEFPWGVWAQPYGVRATRRGDSTGDRWDTTIGGVSGGIDYRLRGDGVWDGLLLGMSFGYAKADTGYRELTDKTKSRAYQMGLYGGWWQGPWSADAGLGFALNRYESRRDLNFGTTNTSAEGRYDGREYSAYAEGRYRHAVRTGGPGSLELLPLAGLQALRLRTDSYTETGAGAMNLNVASDTVSSLKSSLGAAIAYPMAFDDGTVLRPELRARWSHEFGDTDTVVDASFAAAGGSAFQVASDDLGRDAALLGAGIEAQLSPRLSLAAAYDVQLQSGYTAQAVTGRVRIAF